MSMRNLLSLILSLTMLLSLSFAQSNSTENTTVIPGTNTSYVNNVSISGWQGAEEIVTPSTNFYNGTFPANITLNYSGSYPVNNFSLFLADIHFTSGNLSEQYIAYHYCYFVQANFLECLLYNGSDSATSRLKGTEWFITGDLFQQLPFEERKLWHSHPFEILSGLFIAPDLSGEDETNLMQWLMGTYGKVTDVWGGQFGFPLGAPRVGMALALDSQVNYTLADQMDQIFNIGTTWQQRKAARANFTQPPKIEGADWYLTSGEASQYQVYYFPMTNVTNL